MNIIKSKNLKKAKLSEKAQIILNFSLFALGDASGGHCGVIIQMQAFTQLRYS